MTKKAVREDISNKTRDERNKIIELLVDSAQIMTFLAKIGWLTSKQQK